MRAGLLPLAAALSSVANALHFYVDPDAGPKCFFEELPHDTLVVGHYKAEQWDNTLQSWQPNDMISVYISVDVRPPSPSPIPPHNQNLTPLPPQQEVFDNDHRVVSQRGSGTGKFTFTAAEAGDHKLCLTPSSSRPTSWSDGNSPPSGFRVTLDVAIGETSAIESADKGKLQDLASRVKDLNARLGDIRREQVFQRVCPSFSLFVLAGGLCADWLCV